MYPVTIVKARYGGAYEGGAWLAFNCYPDDVPNEIFMDDGICSNWFNNTHRRFVGRGNTPGKAYEDLLSS